MLRPRVSWLVLLLAVAAGSPAPAADESISVKVVGKLRAGVVAIGGETTGFTITANGVTWELDFGKNEELATAAEKLDEKLVVVEGTLQRRAGVEKKERWIVTVKELKEPAKKSVPGERARFRATPGRATSRIRVIDDEDTLVLDVTSEFGIDRAIDRATVERLADAWPKHVIVRLHLGGLESFRAGHGDLAVDWALSADPKAAGRVTLWQGQKETPLAKESPYYTHGRLVGGDGKTPQSGGYFEVPLPAKLLAGNPRQIALRWIDFYRG